MDYTKPVDATQNEIDLELIAAAPDLLVDNKRLQEEVEHHKNMYCVDCGACGDMDSYADKHCICLFKTEGDDE
jgi:L-lactate utilization protein LutB